MQKSLAECSWQLMPAHVNLPLAPALTADLTLLCVPHDQPLPFGAAHFLAVTSGMALQTTGCHLTHWDQLGLSSHCEPQAGGYLSASHRTILAAQSGVGYAESCAVG